MMDKYFDQVFSSYSWSDSDVKERSSWSCSESEQANEMFCGSVGVDEDDNNSSHTYMTNSNQSLESLVAQDASSVNVHDFESDTQDDGKNCNTNVPHGSFKVENLPLQYDVANVGFSNCEPSMFQRFNNDFETLSPIPQVWSLQSYNGASSCLSSAMDQHKRRSFDMKGEYGDNGIYAMPSNPNDLPALATTEQVKQDLGNYPLPPFASTPQIAMAMPALQPFPQSSTAPSSECTTGTAKPRTRARRGQATDPHSIAERLRREKIAERLKNLQEVVPNSNKTDKASMLDEIIEYVKSLQLQVKELSMDTQGTAGAPVAPLITASQRAKGVNGSLISPSISQVADVSFNEIALEQVVRLMETDMSKAMQLLQTNLDLCLMPIALADAVAAEKESSASSPAAPLASGDRKKTTSDDVGHVQNNSSSSSSSNSNSSLPDQQVKQEVNNISFTAA